MGAIRKQSIYSTIFTYIGYAIGAINIVVLFPKFFTPDQLGLTRLVIDVAVLFATLSTFGTIPVVNKFFPFYESYLPKKKNDLPGLTMLICIVGCCMLIILTCIFKQDIVRKFGAKSALFVQYFYLIYPMAITLTFFQLFEAFAWGSKKSVVSNISRELIFRIITTLLIVLYIFKLISIDFFLNIYAYVYVPSLLLLVVYLIKIKAISFHFTISSVTKRLYKRMATFGLFLFSGIMLNVISRTSDIIIISSQSVKGLSDTAVFVVASYFISIMEVPQKSMASTTLPFFAEAWKNKDLKKIHSLYQKTSLNMLLIGFGIAGLIILNIDNCISFLGDTYKPMKLLVLILATGKILDLGTGQNGQILLLSKYWKVDFISNILFVFMAIPLNFFLIKSMGLMGAAYASLIALGIFNLIRFIYIWFIFKMQPFTKQTLYGILIFLVLVAVIYVIPFLHDIYTDSIVRTLLFSILYVGAIKWANVSTDITALINNLFKKIGIA